MKSRKIIYKLSKGICFFCGRNDYAVLDAHRLVAGGVYQPHNMLCLCSNCHRLCHSGEIKVDPKKYTYTKPGFIIHFFTQDKEYWIPEDKGFYSLSKIEEN